MDEESRVLSAITQGFKRAGIPFEQSAATQLARLMEFSTLVLRSSEYKLSSHIGSVPGARSSLKASQLAAVVRNVCGADELNPMFDLPVALETHLGVLTFPIDNPKILGGCAIYDDTAFIFVQRGHNAESLFTCAHQVAHLLTITRNQRKGAWVCKPKTKLNERRGPRENFADMFAGELLVPTRGLGTALREVRRLLRVTADTVGDIELLYLARLYAVSFFAIAKRCEQVGLLPLGGALSLQRFLEKNFRGPERRSHDLNLPDQPAIMLDDVPASLRSMTCRLVSEHYMSADQAARTLGIPVTKLLTKELY